ncbi:hypothetical protein ACOSB0_00400, partial [Candidatus Phytoplasma citri]
RYIFISLMKIINIPHSYTTCLMEIICTGHIIHSDNNEKERERERERERVGMVKIPVGAGPRP